MGFHDQVGGEGSRSLRTKSRKEETGPKGPDDGNRSGEGPLHTGSDQEALLQGEDETRRRWHRDIGARHERNAKRVRLEFDARRGKSRYFDQFGRECGRSPAIGDAGILCLTPRTGKVGRRLLVHRDAMGATGGYLRVRPGIRQRETTAQRIRDENREEHCGEMTEKSHASKWETSERTNAFKV